MELILDTSFVVAMEREARRGNPGPVAAFLAAHATDSFSITFTVAGELACGQSASAITHWNRLCRPYAIVPWTMEVSWQYGELYRHLAASGTLIGTNDMWIAATALAHGTPIVTKNIAEFSRVPSLVVLEF
jgi:tRNA(fMet)-specific endonuclease VapC